MLHPRLCLLNLLIGLTLIACRTITPSPATQFPATRPPATLPPLSNPTPVASSPGGALPAPTADLATIDALFEAILRDLLERDPQWMTSVGLAAMYGSDSNRRLTDFSPEFRAETTRILAAHLAQLQGVDRAGLDDDQRLALDVMIWYLDDAIRNAAFVDDDFPLNPVAGVETALNILFTNDHPLRSWSDAQDYVSRLQAVGTQFDQVLAGLAVSEAKGIVPSRDALTFSLGRLYNAIQAAPTEHPFAQRLRDAVNGLPGVADSDKQALLLAADAAMARKVYPAYRRLISHLEGLQARASAEPGVGQLPDGEAYYAAALRHHTTTDLTPEVIHALGLSEVARLQAELDALFGRLGYPAASLADNFGRTAQDGGFMPSTTSSERAQVVEAFTQLIRAADAAVVPYFNRVPSVPLSIEYEISHGAAYYLSPTLDGLRGGVFMAQLGGSAQARYAMPTLVYHEGVPGHHFQIGLQGELENLRRFQRIINFTAYAEGWALYAERLAWEIGLYATDDYGNIGRIQLELFRAVRLVVDTGLHAQNWSREQAIDYMLENTGLPSGRVTWEVDRYISWPGQACAYTIGALKLFELREQARRELGPRFDLRAFHSAVLEHGPLPLPILEQVVQTYIEQAR